MIDTYTSTLTQPLSSTDTLISDWVERVRDTFGGSDIDIIWVDQASNLASLPRVSENVLFMPLIEPSKGTSDYPELVGEAAKRVHFLTAGTAAGISFGDLDIK